MLSFTGCETPGEEENRHSVLKIKKYDLQVLNHTELINQLKARDAVYYTEDYNTSQSYMLFWYTQEGSVSIHINFQLSCGASSYAGRFFKKLENNSNTLEYGKYSVFSKKDLDENNCLQEGGQLEDLTGSLYGYAEYTQNRVTPTKHTVTSNTITYTAQEINEAFALFDE